MNPETNNPQDQQQVETPSAEQQQQSGMVTAEAHATAIAAKDAEITRLNAEIAALKKAPGDTTSHIVDERRMVASRITTRILHLRKLSTTPVSVLRLSTTSSLTTFVQTERNKFT